MLPTHRLSRNALLPLLLVGALVCMVGATFLLTYAGDDSNQQWQINALIIAYFGLTGGLAIVGYLQLRARRIGLFVLMAGYLVWFSGPALLVLLEGRRFGDLTRYRIPPNAVSEAALGSLVFLAASLLAYGLMTMGLAHRFSPYARPAVGRERAYQVAPWIPLLMLLVFGLVPYIAFGGDIVGIFRSIVSARSGTSTGKGWGMSATTATARGPLIVIGRSAFVTVSGLAWWLVAYHKRFGIRRGQRTALIGLAAFGTILTYFDSGTRTWTLIMIGPPLMGLFVGRMTAGRFIRGTVVGAIVVMIGVVVAQAQRAYRFTANFDDVTGEQLTRLDDTDFFTETAIAFDLVPRRFPYVDEFWPVLFLSNPIPRVFWETKPAPETLRVHSLGRSGFDEYTKDGISRMPGVIGQHWLIGGWIGVLLGGLAWGAMHGFFERLYVNSNGISLAAFTALMGLVWLFGSTRGLYPGFHYAVVLSALVMLARRLGGIPKAPVPAPDLATKKPPLST